ncbi:PspC domain-containing protein [Arthrobacter sp. H16F315]|uniref:PspC domain-containing protein n=1 Tax=Arthrobacter sp. H16F315 TaxID=2955314 RepID=UPI0020972CF0|nr:PspC domain-containing protein [Arthrobacter sp. H16F315]MDD1476772.1 PspC domain-containing protein [Arthrobacter sp. H16F315]
MNPHPEHPDEGNAPAGGAAEDPAAPAADTSAATAANVSATVPLGDSAGSGAGNPPPPPYDYGPTPPPAASPPQDFFDWIRSHGIHRGRERWVGGVASGIARHFGVDPLIVRGILIVLAIFAGVGVLLYGIAWALLPEPDGRIHLQEAAAGRWSSGMTGALITTVVGFPSLGSGAWGWDRYGAGPFLWTVFWVGGAIYLIYYLTHRNKSRNGATALSAGHPDGGPAVHPAYPPKQATPAVPAGAAPFAATGYGASETPAHNGEPTLPAPGWGAPQPPGTTRPSGGGYQPVPGPVQPGKPRKLGPGTPAVAVTAGLALLVGGGIKILDVANLINLGTSGSAVIWASAAVVLGLGILIAGLRGRTSGQPRLLSSARPGRRRNLQCVAQRRPLPSAECGLVTGEHRAGTGRLRHHGRHRNRGPDRALAQPSVENRPCGPCRRDRKQPHGGHPGHRSGGNPGRHDHGQPQ